MDAAALRYAQLHTDLGEDAARETLITELNADWDYVMEAGLTGDGYTIAMHFDRHALRRGLAEYLEYEGTLLGSCTIPIADGQGGYLEEWTNDGTMLFMTSCNSDRIADTLMDAGLGSCVTWEGHTNDKDKDKDSVEAYSAILDGMLEGASQSDALAGLSPDEIGTSGT